MAKSLGKSVIKRYSVGACAVLGMTNQAALRFPISMFISDWLEILPSAMAVEWSDLNLYCLSPNSLLAVK